MADDQKKTTEEKGIMVYKPLAQSHEIKLSKEIVLSLLCRPTKSGALPDNQDVMKFMVLCRARELNPFEGDAFLIGFDSNQGPQFSLITSVQAMYKRAECNPDYDGIDSGVIVRNESGQIIERHGDFVHPGDKLLGGWAIVYRKSQAHPTVERLNLENRDKNRSQWNADKSGMIVKCAEAGALRRAFPSQLAGMYAAGEIVGDGVSTRAYREVSSIDTATVLGNATETPNKPGGATESALKPNAEPKEGVDADDYTMDDVEDVPPSDGKDESA